MGLKTPAEYVESLRDGRVTYWDGERIDDITTHPQVQDPDRGRRAATTTTPTRLGAT